MKCYALIKHVPRFSLTYILCTHEFIEYVMGKCGFKFRIFWQRKKKQFNPQSINFMHFVLRLKLGTVFPLDFK